MADEDRVDPAYTYIDNKVKNLKGQITKLSNRVASLEASGLQEQITSVDSKVRKVDSMLLRLERDVAQLRINHDVLYAQWALQLINSLDSNDCIRHVRETGSAALSEINTSSTPHKVADNWYSKCTDYFHKHGGFETFG